MCVCALSRGKEPKPARQDFARQAFESEAYNEGSYFPGTLQLNYGRSKLVTIFYIRPLERIT